MSDPKYLQDGLDAQAAHVVEEAGEVLKELGDLLAAIGKTKRWGWKSVNPELPPHQREKNLDWVRRATAPVRREISDLLQAIDRLEQTIDLDPSAEF